MQRPPSLDSWTKYPVTVCLAVLSIGSTLLWWSGRDMSAFFCDFEVSQGQVYRLLSCTLLHGSILHLAFNIYWLWVFGSLVEATFGHLWTLGIYLLLALTSSAAQYALSTGGVGLSGIGYGLFAFLWALNRWDRRFAYAMDPQIARLFVAWFVFCIVATRMNVMNVGNIAHGAGAIMGLLLGLCVTLERSWKPAGIAAAIGYVGACMLAAFVLRPVINMDVDIGEEFAKLGSRAQEARRFEEAADYYQKAIEADPKEGDYYFKLGTVLGDLNRFDEAVTAFSEAAKLSGADQDASRTGVQLAAIGLRALQAEKYDEAVKHYRRAIDVDAQEPSHWYNLGLALTRMKKYKEALPKFEQAVKLAPEDKESKATLEWCRSTIRKMTENEEKRARDKAKVKEAKDKVAKEAEKAKAK